MVNPSQNRECVTEALGPTSQQESCSNRPPLISLQDCRFLAESTDILLQSLNYQVIFYLSSFCLLFLLKR